MWEAFYELEDAAGGFPLQMGLRSTTARLLELGMEWAKVLHIDGSAEFFSSSPPTRCRRALPTTSARSWAAGHGLRRDHRPSRAIRGHPEGHRHRVRAGGDGLQAAGQHRLHRGRSPGPRAPPAIRMLKGYSYFAATRIMRGTTRTSPSRGASTVGTWWGKLTAL